MILNKKITDIIENYHEISVGDVLDSFHEKELKKIIYGISKNINYESISWLMELLHKGNFHWDYVNEIIWQLRCVIFRNYSLKLSYQEEKRMLKILTDSVLKQISMEMSYIPYEERNKNTILITTDQFLSTRHEPTQIISDIMLVLGKLNYRVYLLINTYQYDTDALRDIWAAPVKKNIIRELYREGLSAESMVAIRFVQIDYVHNTREKLELVENFINTIKPEFIWHMGGIDAISEMIGKKSTFISTKFSDGYASSEADILAAYTITQSEYNRQANSIIEINGQKAYKFKIPLGNKFATGKISCQRKDFQLPENNFLLVLVGNRLKTEINQEMQKWLKDLMSYTQDFFLVTIGEEIEITSELDKNRVKQLGYQENLSDVISLCNIFINPPRQGGAGGAFAALAGSVPVFTMPDCDVNNTVPNTFLVNNLDEMRERVIRCYENRDYYNQMRAEAKGYYIKRMDGINNKEASESVEQLFLYGRHLIGKQEIK